MNDRTTMSTNQGTTATIFEKSRPGRRAFRLPRWEGAESAPEEFLPAHLVRQGRIGLPEVGELSLMRHYIELSVKNATRSTVGSLGGRG